MCSLDTETMNIIKDIVIPLLSVIVSAFVAYRVAIMATKAEEDKGKALLENLCNRYFISLSNSFDGSTKQIKTDPLTKKQYIAELEAIISDLSGLSTNPFYIRFLRSSPYSAKHLVQVRRELVEHDANPSFVLNLGTAKGFASMYRECRKGLAERQPIEDIIEIIENMPHTALEPKATAPCVSTMI